MNNSSSKKNAIPSADEYYRLLDLYHDAFDRLQSGGTGSGYGDIHFEVMHELSRYGIASSSRDNAVHLLKQLLTEYERTELGSSNTTQSAEDYLSKFDDI